MEATVEDSGGGLSAQAYLGLTGLTCEITGVAMRVQLLDIFTTVGFTYRTLHRTTLASQPALTGVTFRANPRADASIKLVHTCLHGVCFCRLPFINS